jgi:hypothetical protein
MKAEKKQRREADKAAGSSTLSVGALAQAYQRRADGRGGTQDGSDVTSDQ